jgi:hypothetical protein
MATQVDLGKIRPVWKGDWTSSTAYEQNDMIRHGVNSYICVTAHTSGGSFSDANWNVIAYGAELPAQSGNSGKVLVTDGSSLSWGDGEQTGTSITQFHHTSNFTPTNETWHTLTAWTRQPGDGHFLANGSLVSESGGVFSFAETGTYLIYGSVANSGGNSLRRFIVNGQSSKDGGSTWGEIGRAVISRYDTGGAVWTCPTWIGTMNVDDISNSKFSVRVYVERASGTDYVGAWDDHLPWTFMKLSEAY